MALGYDDTPFIPGQQWRVHDGSRPQPPVVTPGATAAGAPSDATVLFDGSSLDAWESAKAEGGSAQWKLENGYMEVVPKTGNIKSKAKFGGHVQLHLEFASPSVVKGEGQGRGNSGVFLMEMYEIQVLDNYNNPTYPDGTVGGIYGQWNPLANAIRKPGEWNTYDIIWDAPRFDGDKLLKPAYVTVILNGVILHHHKKLDGPTKHKVTTEYVAHPDALSLILQDHGDLVRFRNIWYRDIGTYS